MVHLRDMGLYNILVNTTSWNGITKGNALNHEEVLAIFPDSREEAVSIWEIAQAMGLEISSYVDWGRAERRLVRALCALIKWGWVPVTRGRKRKATGSGTTPTAVLQKL